MGGSYEGYKDWILGENIMRKSFIVILFLILLVLTITVVIGLMIFRDNNDDNVEPQYGYTDSDIVTLILLTHNALGTIDYLSTIDASKNTPEYTLTAPASMLNHKPISKASPTTVPTPK